MKKLVLSLAILGLILTLASCNKSKNDGTNPQQAGVSFSIKPGTTPGGLKSDCWATTASYAKVWLNVMNGNQSVPYNNGTPIKITIFYLAGVPYTNSIQLSPGTYTVEDFIIYNDNQTPNSETDDIVIAATPHTNQVFAPYVTHPLTWNFTVAAFEKLQQPIEAVCYQQSNYSDFGFVFFLIDQLNMKDAVFFGDLCAKDFANYTGSHYANQHAGLQPDMPAIFKIDVLKNGSAYKSFNNDSINWYGEGRPMRVYYADQPGVTENFEFRLSVLVKTGASFSFVYFSSWYSTDGGPLYTTSGTHVQSDPIADKDGNGVIDFSLGYCNPNADLVLPPYMNLPLTCSYTITGATAPGSQGGYVDASLVVGGAAGNYELQTQTYPSYCVETGNFINIGQTYTMNVYSSLYPAAMPSYAQAPAKPWYKINWLINHLDWFPGYHWYDLQGAIWTECGWTGNPSETGIPFPVSGSIAYTMIQDMDLYGTASYQVPTGGWACVVFIDAANLTPHTQTMFVKVDP